MKRAIASICLAGMLSLGGGTVALAQDTDTTEDSTSDDNSDMGLWGLAGLVGLLGLAGLARRDRDDTYRRTDDRTRTSV